MLVTLATNQTVAANSSSTYTYSPDSVQKVLIRMEDADWEASTVTVQIGSKTICNGASAWGLAGLSSLQSNFQFATGADGTLLCLDFGNHECAGNDNLYVTVQAVAEVSYVDVSALVDKPGGGIPVKITEYSDTTFTSQNNLMALSFDSANQTVDEDAYNCEIRTSISSSAPSFISAASYFAAESLNNNFDKYFGVLNIHSVPLKTTYNYNSSAVTDRIITVEQMGTSRTQQAQARQSARVAISQAGK